MNLSLRQVAVSGLVALLATAARAELPPVNDGKAHGDPPFMLEDGWKPLLNGRDLDGWYLKESGKGEWTATRAVFWAGPDAAAQFVPTSTSGDRIVNGPTGGTSNLITKEKFGDFELYVEFMIAATHNSGVLLHGLYEIQIKDTYGVEPMKMSDSGGIYSRWEGAKLAGGAAPRVNASRPAGQWQSFHIWFQSPRFDAAGKKIANAKVVRMLYNGVLIHENVEIEQRTPSLDIPEAPTNPLMLQGDQGPVAFRNIYIRPLRPIASR
jgi:hypothetical protein